MKKNINTTTILIVDDTEQNLRLLTHVLESEGYQISTARKGEEALLSVKETKPDIILLDVMMPGMNGFEVCQALKESVDSADIPVIFLSALSEIDSKVKGFNAGGVDYITKPFQREEVLARIELHVRLTRLQNQLEEKVLSLKERERKLNQLNHHKDELMRIVSHDIRNPVTGIIGIAQLLREYSGSMPEEDRMAIYKTIEESGRKIETLVNDLLQKKEAEKELFTLERESVDLRELVSGVVELHKPSALMKNITLDMDVEQEIFFDLDRKKMNEVLGNLVSNAIKFTPEGGEVIICAVKKAKDGIKIKVKDSGIGIPKDKIEDLLSGSSERLIREGTRQEKSSGLGLGIIRQFTELHGGTLKVDSNTDKGSVFIIDLK